jgi:hypothetical protein
MVTIPSPGPIFPKGGINGPILTPYREDVQTIGILLMRGHRVTEVLPNAESIELNLSNFDQDNGASRAEQEVLQAQAQEAQRIANEEAARKVREEAEKLAAEQAQRDAEQAKLDAEEAQRLSNEEAVVKVQKTQQPQKNPHKNNHKQHVQADKLSTK